MYFITSVSEDDTRCVGYYSDFEKANVAVESNSYDLNEAGCYPYVVIENIKEGIYQYDFNPVWYKYNKDAEKYEKSERPSFIEKNLIGFGIG